MSHASSPLTAQANVLRVSHVERCFGSAGVPLQRPGRVLLGEGLLTKVCRKSAKPRQFFLFSDLLVYGTVVQERKKYTKQHIIPLDGIGIISLPDTSDLQHAWVISSEQKSFVVFAASALEKAEWINHLAEASGVKPATSADDDRFAHHAPTWTPDYHTSECMHCRSTKFGTIKRRHHCRKCGIVVCSGCSSQRLVLPAISSKPVRVCDSCHHRETGKEAAAKINTVAQDAADQPEPSSADSASESDIGSPPVDSEDADEASEALRRNNMRNARLSEADDAGVAPTADELAQGNGAVHTDLSPAELLRASQVLADLTVDAPTTFYDEEPAST